MRGQRIFREITTSSETAGASRKGRSNTLVFKRNECLVARYYYYAAIKHKCYEDILRLLMAEFFLSPHTIANIVQDNTEQLLALKQKGPSLFFFQNRWGWMKW